MNNGENPIPQEGGIPPLDLENLMPIDPQLPPVEEIPTQEPQNITFVEEAPVEELQEAIPMEEAPIEEPQETIPVEEAPVEELQEAIPVEEAPIEEPQEAVPVEEAPIEEPQEAIPVEEAQEAIPVEEAPVEELQEAIPVEEAPIEEPQEAIPVEEAPIEQPQEAVPVEEAPIEEPQEAIPVEEAPAEEPQIIAPVEEVPVQPQQSPLYHELLDEPTIGIEIAVDEQAVDSAGLLRPGDAEVEQIIQETRNMDRTRRILPVSLPSRSHDKPVQENKTPMKKKERKKITQSDASDTPKGRPKRKKGYGLLGIPHIISTAIWLAITVLIGVSLGRMIWVCAAEVLAFGRPDLAVTVTVSDGDNVETISNKLKAAGLIKYPQLFKMYADLTDAEEEISSGTFTLNTKFDYHALVNGMSYHSPARETIELVIPEGYTCAQIFALLEEEGVCSAAELEEYAANGEIKERWFLEGITRGDKYCLEGYLFPDTYEFYTNDEPGRVLGKFLDNFDNRFTDLMRERIDTLNQRMAKVLAGRGYTEEQIASRLFDIRDIVIIASMIERESANDAESYDISSVIYNRLTNPANYPYLNIDATLIYALGGNIDPETGKTKPLTLEDLQLEHPYNTYTVKGLIPGPISNPGRNSLNAALDPTETSFYYYVYNPNTSEHLFAKNDKEHQKNVDYVKSLGAND